MFDSSVLVSFSVATVLVLVVPGPCLILLVSTGVSQGKPAAMFVAGGIALSDLLGSLLTAFGLVVWLTQMPTALSLLKGFGMLYLLYSAYGEWRLAKTIQVWGQPRASYTNWKGFWRGFWINNLNPVWLFLLGFFPQFVRLERGDVQTQLLMLALMFVFLSALFGVVVAYLSGSLGRMLVRFANTPQSHYFLMGVYSLLALYFVLSA